MSDVCTQHGVMIEMKEKVDEIHIALLGDLKSPGLVERVRVVESVAEKFKALESKFIGVVVGFVLQIAIVLFTLFFKLSLGDR